MSDANYTQIAYKKETTFGVTPSPTVLKILRLTGESLSHSKETVKSEEIRADRQVSDLIKVGAMAEGSIEFELSQAEYQPWMLAALGAADWTTVNVTATATASALAQTLVTTGGGFANVPVGGFVKVAGLTASASNGIKRVLTKSVDNNTLTLAAGSIASAQVGASVTITAKDARNGIEKTFHTIERRILSPDGAYYFQKYTGMAVDEFSLEIASKAIVTGSMTFMGKVGSSALNSANNTNAAYATGALTFDTTDPSDGDVVVIGNRTYTLKTTLTPAADEVLISGTPATMAENLRDAIRGDSATFGTSHYASTEHSQVTVAEAATAVVTVTAILFGTAANAFATTTTMGAGAGTWGAATLTGGVAADAFTAATTDPILNGTSNVGQVFKGDAISTERFKMLGLTIKNNLRGKDAIGEEGAFEIGYGTIDVSGSIEAYFRNNDFYAALIAHEYSGLAVVLTDSAGKSLAFTMPYVNFGKGDPNAEGINTDIMLKTDWTAIMDPDLLCTIIINAFD